MTHLKIKNGHESNKMLYAMLKISRKNTIHFTGKLKNTATHAMTIFSFLCWLFCCDDSGESSTVCVLHHCICKSVLPCRCSINRTFTPYKANVPDQSIVFVCIVFVPIKKCSLISLCSLCSFFFRNTILPTTIMYDTDQEYTECST